ncbi:hypothetical protein CO174_03860 [Candidatus Uhrbacteria bacterium CG_4_9_14_3_um_filter_50_9]|uniref:Uncharacterized protein n=1 Tax=Candidatus Uhrbacteria bacterium CG_4_9_14_3_um_filter_50_9 TaxID=1975035 RepID=A0A2M7XBT4_9BACT|nr:MAG: hypothetical protein CO174_03860 [Candidatus Uhrbacteria bacterium CG_4_9_14_3_um_filter_50_9]
METGVLPFTIVLGILWFLVYWVLGGVFFALIAIMRLGRLRKVRFSCLFSILALMCGVGASVIGLTYSETAVEECMLRAVNKAETVSAVFGCGFIGVFGAFLMGAAVLTIGGFLIMTISKSKTKPWIVLDQEDEGIEEQDLETQEKSKFF